jgi:lysophospholipase L1-like esterase
VDLALIVIGANDLARFVPAATGARLLHDAVSRLRGAGASVVVAPAPDLGVVAHVPVAYRAFVSAASAHYARAQGEAATRAGAVVAAVGSEVASRFAADRSLFSADLFHPSSDGYAVIAGVLAPYVDLATSGEAERRDGVGGS